MSPWLYEDPAEMDYDHIDPVIRELVRDINGSGWLLTEESCAGHPANEPSAWGCNEILYLRLVMPKNDDLFYILFLADRLQASCQGLLGWHSQMCYDRSDELGSHWLFNFKYGPDISYRSIAVDTFHRAVLEVNLMRKTALR